MYRRPRFLEILHQIREEMSREVDYDVDLFAEMVRKEPRKINEDKLNFDLDSLNLESVMPVTDKSSPNKM